MPVITLHNGSKLASEAVDYARFWEKGAESVPDDTLVIMMKDPSFKSDPITGQDACDDVKALEEVGVPLPIMCYRARTASALSFSIRAIVSSRDAL